jgi:hypothetical protein
VNPKGESSPGYSAAVGRRRLRNVAAVRANRPAPSANTWAWTGLDYSGQVSTGRDYDSNGEQVGTVSATLGSSSPINNLVYDTEGNPSGSVASTFYPAYARQRRRALHPVSDVCDVVAHHRDFSRARAIDFRGRIPATTNGWASGFNQPTAAINYTINGSGNRGARSSASGKLRRRGIEAGRVLEIWQSDVCGG